METWKAVAGWAGFYEVSSLGRVRSLARLDTAGRRRAEKFMRPSKGNTYGHLAVTLTRGERRGPYLVHALVAEAFHGSRPDGMECRHKNGIRTDNRAENLAWGSHTENVHDAISHGTFPKGELNGNSKLIGCDYERIRDLRRMGVTCRDIGSWIGVSAGRVSAIARA